MYDTEAEEFKPVKKDAFDGRTMTTAEGMRVFEVGEVFNLRGLDMVIRKITKKDLLLRPVKVDKK